MGGEDAAPAKPLAASLLAAGPGNKKAADAKKKATQAAQAAKAAGSAAKDALKKGCKDTLEEKGGCKRAKVLCKEESSDGKIIAKQCKRTCEMCPDQVAERKKKEKAAAAAAAKARMAKKGKGSGGGSGAKKVPKELAEAFYNQPFESN